MIPFRSLDTLNEDPLEDLNPYIFDILILIVYWFSSVVIILFIIDTTLLEEAVQDGVSFKHLQLDFSLYVFSGKNRLSLDSRNI